MVNVFTAGLAAAGLIPDKSVYILVVLELNALEGSELTAAEAGEGLQALSEVKILRCGALRHELLEQPVQDLGSVAREQRAQDRFDDRH